MGDMGGQGRGFVGAQAGLGDTAGSVHDASSRLDLVHQNGAALLLSHSSLGANGGALMRRRVGQHEGRLVGQHEGRLGEKSASFWFLGISWFNCPSLQSRGLPGF